MCPQCGGERPPHQPVCWTCATTGNGPDAAHVMPPRRPPAFEPGPCDVTFTQYLRPDGRTRATWIERSAETAAAASALRAAGCRFDIEELQTGEVSMTVERDDEDGETAVLAHEVCANGPAVLDAVDRLVAAAAKEAA